MTARSGLNGGLNDLESKPLVVRDVGRIRRLEVAGQAGFVGQGKSGFDESRSDAAALRLWMNSQGLQIPRTDRRVRIYQRGTDVHMPAERAWRGKRNSQQRRGHPGFPPGRRREGPGRHPERDTQNSLAIVSVNG